ncbi:paired amphipathic helix protein sin3a [Colletotrichum tofieldiae]|nr:paired amphipathic helix protein sin3a [Colletotrichum tofieldiae]GKT81241.1 paired amphipathic helix protein sin3a [Colletotrichum tofieldiae]
MTLMKLSPLSLLLAGLVAAQGQQNVQFNQVINVNGDMQLNSLIFPDNTKIETFSQTQRQVIVNQNPSPLPASHVVGSTGQPFVQLSRNSLTIQTNGATDLVGAQIELPIDQNMLQQAGVTADNTFVAMLSKDRQAWIIMEGVKSVNITDANVRMVKLNQIDGEYVAVGRQTSELGVSLTPFGQPVNIAGSGIQEAEFQDGFRMSIRASQPMSIRTDVVNGISADMVTNGIMSINNYRYLVTSNLAGVVPSLNNMAAVVQMPRAAPQTSITLGIAQRPVLQNPGGATGGLQAPRIKRQEVNNGTAGAQPPASGGGNTAGNGAGTAAGNAPAVAPPPAGGNTQNPPQQGQNPPQQGQNPPSNAGPAIPAATQLLLAQTFSPINAQVLLDRENARIAVPVNQIDGEFILTMMVAGTPVGTQPQPAPQQGQPQQGQPQQGGGQQQGGGLVQPGAPQQGGGGITGAQPGQAQPGLAPAGVPKPASPAGRPARRQGPEAPPAAAPIPMGGFEMKMTDLMAMAEAKRNGGVMATWEMMANFAAQQKPEQKRSDITRRRSFPVRRRLGVHF